MKKVINGLNVDTTAVVVAWLRDNNAIHLATLYLLGEPDDPTALRLTSWESPLTWSIYGKFLPAAIKRASVKSLIGLDVSALELIWNPPVTAPTQSLATANAYQKALVGYYDDWPVRIWTTYMPTPGDADTYGCSELFGGRIGATEIGRGEIKFTCNSFLDVINQNIPGQVIESTNPLAASTAATPPSGMSSIPRFNVIAGSTQNVLILDMTAPTPHFIFDDNVLFNGFLVFNNIPGATLGRQWSAIQANKKVTIDSVDYNEVELYTTLPFEPTVGADTCYISGKAPINLNDPNYQGFPYVPQPANAI